ncbi:MAG: class I SAM-dependent methyltransferase [Thiobacillaceae bacterium]
MNTTGELTEAKPAALTCRVCGSTAHHQTYQAREMMFGTRETFEYFLCRDCGCLQISDIPSDVARYYPTQYYSLAAAQRGRTPSALVHAFQKQRARTALFGTGYKLSRLLGHFVDLPDAIYRCGEIVRNAALAGFDEPCLDVGCGARSWWLAGLRELGFTNLLGIDPYIERDTLMDDVNIVKKSIDQIDGTFSLVTFHHSFEHIADPYMALGAVKNLLAPQGVCLLRVPIVSSEAWDKYGVDWVELDAPRHFYLHSVKSIEEMAERAGFEVFKVVYDADEFEIYGSEQYRLGIPLMADDSYFVAPERSIFKEQDILRFRNATSELNRIGRGGRAGFYLRLKADQGRSHSLPRRANDDWK